MSTRSLYVGSYSRSICLLLAWVIAVGPTAAAIAQQPAQPREVETRRLERIGSDTTLIAAPEAGKKDVKYVTPQAVAYLSVRPQQFLTSPNTALLPVEVASAAGLRYLGIDPVDVTEVVAFIEPPNPLAVSYGIVVKFAKPFDIRTMPPAALEHLQPAKIGDADFLQSTVPLEPSFYMPDDRTLVLMPEATLRRVLAATATVQSPLVDRVRELPSGSDLYIAIDVASLRPLIKPWLNVAVIKAGDKFPTEAKPFLEVADLVQAVDFTFNMSNTGPTALVLHANDATSADRLETLSALAMELQARNWAEKLERFDKSEDPVERAVGQYIKRISTVSTEVYHPSRHGDSLVLFRGFDHDDPLQQRLVTVAVAGIVVALSLPAMQAAREAARRNQSINNLRQMMLASHAFADQYKKLPAHAIYGADGKPLLSWRVLLLPYLGQQVLYNQFRLNEPWDSEHNRGLIAQMPKVYANPNGGEPGKTSYLAVVGDECIMNGTNVGIPFAKLTDGTSKTIMFVEANPDVAVEWTKPDDLELDLNSLSTALRGFRPGGFLAAWGDGHISFVPLEIDPQTLKALFTRDGGEATPDF